MVWWSLGPGGAIVYDSESLAVSGAHLATPRWMPPPIRSPPASVAVGYSTFKNRLQNIPLSGRGGPYYLETSQVPSKAQVCFCWSYLVIIAVHLILEPTNTHMFKLDIASVLASQVLFCTCLLQG